MTFTGPISLSGSSSFSGDYAIPTLAHCGLLTPVLNLVIPGPGNVFRASFSPATAAPSGVRAGASSQPPVAGDGGLLGLGL